MRSYSAVLKDVERDIYEKSFTNEKIVNANYTIGMNHLVIGYQGFQSYTGMSYDNYYRRITEYDREIAIYDLLVIDLDAMSINSQKCHTYVILDNIFDEKIMYQIGFKEQYLVPQTLALSILKKEDDDVLVYNNEYSFVGAKHGDITVSLLINDNSHRFSFNDSKEVCDQKVFKFDVFMYVTKGEYVFQLEGKQIDEFFSCVKNNKVLREMKKAYQTLYIRFEKMNDDRKNLIYKIFPKKIADKFFTPVFENDYIVISMPNAVAKDRNRGFKKQSDYIKKKFKMEIPTELLDYFISYEIFGKEDRLTYDDYMNKHMPYFEYDNGVVFLDESEDYAKHVYFIKTDEFGLLNIYDPKYTIEFKDGDEEEILSNINNVVENKATRLYYEHKRGIEVLKCLGDESYQELYEHLKYGDKV